MTFESLTDITVSVGILQGRLCRSGKSDKPNDSYDIHVTILNTLLRASLSSAEGNNVVHCLDETEGEIDEEKVTAELKDAG